MGIWYQLILEFTYKIAVTALWIFDVWVVPVPGYSLSITTSRSFGEKEKLVPRNIGTVASGCAWHWLLSSASLYFDQFFYSVLQDASVIYTPTESSISFNFAHLFSKFFSIFFLLKFRKQKLFVNSQLRDRKLHRRKFHRGKFRRRKFYRKKFSPHGNFAEMKFRRKEMYP